MSSIIQLAGRQPKPADRPRDDDGWILPDFRDTLGDAGQPPAERRKQDHLTTILEAHRWQVNRQVHCYDMLGRSFRPDLIVRHSRLLDVPGAVEVKADITHFRDAFEILYQAIHYGRSKILATGERICWSAVYPWKFGLITGDMTLVFRFASVGFKVLAFVDDRDRSTYSYYDPRGLHLLYSGNHRVWNTRSGFSEPALDMALGRRHVGGRRI